MLFAVFPPLFISAISLWKLNAAHVLMRRAQSGKRSGSSCSQAGWERPMLGPIQKVHGCLSALGRTWPVSASCLDFQMRLGQSSSSQMHGGRCMRATRLTRKPFQASSQPCPTSRRCSLSDAYGQSPAWNFPYRCLTRLSPIMSTAHAAFSGQFCELGLLRP